MMNAEGPNIAPVARNPYSKASSSKFMTVAEASSIAQPPISDTTTASSKDNTDHETKLEYIPISNNLPMVDRLLSRTLSFTSAEIVTLRELSTAVTFSSQSSVSFNKSVRVIGHISLVDTVNMWVLLSDPSSCQAISTTLNPYQKGRPSDGIRFSIEGKSDFNSNRVSIDSLPRKRKLVSVKTPSHGSILNKRLSGIDTVKGDSLLTKPKDPAIAVIEDNQRRNIPMVIVDIHLVPSLFNCTVGDSLMVIGEIQNISSKVSNSSNILDFLKILYPICPCPEQDSSLKMDETHRSDTNKIYNYYFIQARILRNYNGIDMTLFEEALKLRRKYLKDQGAQYGTGLESRQAGENTNDLNE